MSGNSVLEFKDDDAGFVSWRDAHQNGYVVNCARNPSPKYLKLHRTSCPHINNLRNGYRCWTCGEYTKVCSMDRHSLDVWARVNVSPAASVSDSCHCNK